MRRRVILLAVVWFVTATIADAQVLSQGWGSTGSGTGQLQGPWGIAIDYDRFVYVVDEMNHRIQKFDPDGNFVVQWGGYGTGNGEFAYPTGLTVDAYGAIYVADRYNNRIQKFVQATPCPAGMPQVASGVCFERTWGTYGTGPGEFGYPVALAVDPPDAFGNVSNLYVADSSNNRIQMFSVAGTFILQWGTQGSGNGQLYDPWGIAVDPARNVYVSERINNRVQKFGQFGNYLGQWGSSGTGNGQFNGPVGLDLDAFGNVFVTDEFNSRIQKFTNSGGFLASFGQLGTLPEDLRFPLDVAVDHTDPFGTVYIADYRNDRVERLSYPDTDGDALPDVWETSGLDINGDGTVDLDLPALGASPTHKDVFLEVDHLEFHTPNPSSMNAIVTAYANGSASNPDGTAGITLHLDVDDQIPHQVVSSWPDFDALKSTHFGTAAQRASANAANVLLAKRMVYHYALVSHTDSGIGGVGELLGDDVWMLTGGSDGTPASPEDESGGLMHELGHNVGLDHGGNEPINCKPNYFSIMNYSWTWNWIKYFVSGYSRPLDYSREVNPTLNEGSLSEAAGVATTSSTWLYTFYGPSSLISPVNVPIDWNADGDAVDAGVSANINVSGGCNGTGTILQGFNDWANLKFNFRGARFFLANAHPTETEHPPHPSDEVIDAFLATTTLPVHIDINPVDATNTIRVTGKSLVPVAVLTDTFDAAFVEPSTVTFGPGQAQPVSSALIDADGDGDRDLVLVFDRAMAGLTCGTTRATLRGKTRAQGRIEGTDRVMPTPCR